MEGREGTRRGRRNGCAQGPAIGIRDADLGRLASGKLIAYGCPPPIPKVSK